MSTLSELIPASEAGARKLLVAAHTRHVPDMVRQLNEWQYLERTLHRVMAAWGRHHAELEDKAALHRHIWDQAEIIRRLRDRIEQFPGGKPEAAVHPAFEELGDRLLFAPTFQDALDAIYHTMLRALVSAYADHVRNAHPIHDAPTIALLHEINTLKEQHYFWYRNYRRQNPHSTDAAYLQTVEEAITDLQAFNQPMPTFTGKGAAICGSRKAFRLPRSSARPKDWRSEYNIMPYLTADFPESVEARRLFWAIGYLYEINLPDNQLRWLYDGSAMPWAWHHDISRHLWDESRHGLSGYSRLQDWGISLSDVGLPTYDPFPYRSFPPEVPLAERLLNPWNSDEECGFLNPADPLTPAELYEEVFQIGLVAESGHFHVKNEAYTDFREGGDFESAEMMLFDIIDETAHVQYAHRWLPELAKLADIDNTDYRARATRVREEKQKGSIDGADSARKEAPRTAGYGPWEHYQELLRRIRESTPLKPEFKAARRSYLPM